VIKYIGSKRMLLPAITGIVQSLPGVASVLDPFSGTARVGHAL
jgi:adenine-specific DNA-methyltransferase